MDWGRGGDDPPRIAALLGVAFVLGSFICASSLEEAWALGPQEVLGKPIALDRLLTAIQLVLVCREC